MDNKPNALTDAEINEIAAIEDIQDMWWAENAEEMADILKDEAYAVRFNFKSGSPGYRGDLFYVAGILYAKPVVLVREGGNGRIKIAEPY